MSDKELNQLKEDLERLDRQALETDRAVEELKRSTAETTERIKKLDERADFVQRRLAAVR